MGKKNVAGKTTPQPKQKGKETTEDSSKTDVEEDSD